MNRLIINTANEDLYILLNADKKFYSKDLNNKIKHNEAIIPTVDSLLSEAGLQLKDIDEFGVVVGPGSFTGIRVGIATIKAFRDAIGVKAKGINNLDLLFELAKILKPKTKVVAIKGSRDSYFVAREVNGAVYKYDRNLTTSELLDLAGSSLIGMYEIDDNLPCFKVNLDNETLDSILEKSTDENLIPVYYQLSQAEREKQQKFEIEIVKPEIKDAVAIADIEANTMTYNVLNRHQIESILRSKSGLNYVAKVNGEIVGFVLAECSDEINIVSLAVDPDFRNLGIATKLIDMLNKSLNSNCTVISLEVKKDNARAYVLYEKLGFKVRRIRKKYYDDGSDCIEMVLTKN